MSGERGCSDIAMPLTRLSLRDPDGDLFSLDGRLLRALRPQAIASWRSALAAPSLRQFWQAGRLATTVELSKLEAESVLHRLRSAGALSSEDERPLVLEHEPIPFRSYALEWPAEMLHAAGSLTLDLAEAALCDGLGLKDASAANVLFDGANPRFVDVLSFERRDPNDLIWLPFAQFMQQFVFPLAASAATGFSMASIFASRRDGLSATELLRSSRWRQRLRPTFFLYVTLPSLMRRRERVDEGTYSPRRAQVPGQARFSLERLFRMLRAQLNSALPRPARSTWSRYLEGDGVYTDAQLEEKSAWLDNVLSEAKPRAVLDVGCNRGRFSIAAARAGARVVAVDADPVVVGMTWAEARRLALPITPLVVDLTQPTPGTGFLNAETLPFLERAESAFDAVMMLAVLHHLTVGAGLRFAPIVDLVAKLTRKTWIVEFVGPNDLSVRHLARGRDLSHLGRDEFERVAERRFRVINRAQISGADRYLYTLAKI